MHFNLLRVPITAIVLVSCVWIGWGAAGQNPGAPEMTLDGGSTGSVAFPHLRHQEALSECTLCHGLFPKEAGAIAAMKAAGKLMKKEVMNKQCVKCHKQKKNDGVKAGPTTCKQCHNK